MSNSSLPIDRIVDLIKNLLDGIRCPICDKAVGGRSRYPCGHHGCDDCMTVSEECCLCLTAPLVSTNIFFCDEPFTKRVKSANNLLDVCQQTFNINIFKYQRVSGQLKIEKELFPECIQAPFKYYNKRKSLASSNKENSLHLLFPGEHISPSKEFKMRRYSNSVQQWLDDNETHSRKVFSELNVNQPNYINRSNKFTESTLDARKRVYSFSPVRQREKSFSLKKRFKMSNIGNQMTLLDKKQIKSVHEDSGIVLDEEPIYIEDSQSETVDKDKLAFLAIQQADKEFTGSKSVSETQQLKQHIEENISNSKFTCNALQSKTQLKVPFYKRSPLIETCVQCEEKQFSNDSLATYNQKKMSVSIKNCGIITTIEISNDVESTQEKNTIGVQTDVYNLTELGSSYTGQKKDNAILFSNSVGKNNSLEKEEQKSQDMFTDECELNIIDDIVRENAIQTHTEDILSKNKNIVIDDSESDTLSGEPSFLQVIADVHVSCEPHEYGILSKINTDQSICRTRNKVRGATPDSNNSSEKENCDPNKSKKQKGNKKSKSPKKKHI